MNLIIENMSSEPLYGQIARQIREAILSGKLYSGEPLPSIRHLAKELQVSIITTKRAYEELEREGFIQSAQGKGTFVAPATTQRLKEAAMSRMEQSLSQVIQMAHTIDLSWEEFQEMILLLWDMEESGG